MENLFAPSHASNSASVNVRRYDARHEAWDGDLPSVDVIDQYQCDALADAKWPHVDEAPFANVMRWVAANHRFNSLLWEQEDLARRQNVADAEIVSNKRAIDRYNQQRNDAIEAIDEAILTAMQEHAPRPGALLNSETAGSIIDRLSINSLKIHNMRLQIERRDVDETHKAACAAKADRLEEQRKDLLECLNALLDGMRNGSRTFKIYRQFKMYNDPAMNPYLAAGSSTRN